MDKANLESIIAAMEAIGRTHQITRAFLQQSCLDIERNNLGDILQLPSLTQYRDLYGGPASNIPLLARNAVGRHTEVSPVLPGRLPLGQPKGNVRNMKVNIPKNAYLQHVGSCQSLDMPAGHKAFGPLLGAVNRNLSVAQEQNDAHSNKRKRMSPSPTPKYASFNSLDVPITTQPSGFTLPDRTSPASSSSIQNRASTGAGTRSGDSSHASPSVGGLGNTREENRVDLRPFQDRISTPIWEATEEDLMDSEWIRRVLSEENTNSWSFLMGLD